MNQKASLKLRDLMDRDEAWGTDEGHEVYLKLVRFVERHAGVTVFVVSLEGIRRTDSSFPRESVMEVARRYRKKAGFCLVDVANEDLIDNWDAAAQKKEQPMFVWLDTGHRLLGPKPSTGNAEVLDFVLSRFETRAADLVKDLSVSGIANASMKLKQLWEQGFILRRKEVADSGGIEFTYSPVR